MNQATRPFNPFDYLQSREEMADYLRACLREDDPQVFINALGHLARHQGVSEVARAAGLKRESLYRVFNGRSQPRWDTVVRLLRALDIDLTVAA